MKNIGFWERVVLRGLEGIIGDQCLLRIMQQPQADGLADFMEAKYMAEQVFAQMRGWGLV